MNNMTSAIRHTVSISQFNKGQAGKIFEAVRKEGAKVVMKNNEAVCVLLSPEEYVRLIDELEDMKLAAMAEERLAHFDPSQLLTMEEMDEKLGIKPEDLEGFEDVEIE